MNIAESDSMGAPKHTEETRQQALSMRAQGLPFAKIANALGCGAGTVHRWCELADEQVAEQHGMLKRAYAQRAWEKALEALEHLTPEKYENASAQQVATTAAIMFDKAAAAMGNDSKQGVGNAVQINIMTGDGEQKTVEIRQGDE